MRRTSKSCGPHACHDCIVEEARAFGKIQKHGGDESESRSRTCGARGDRDLKEAMLRRRDLSTSAIGLATFRSSDWSTRVFRDPAPDAGVTRPASGKHPGREHAGLTSHPRHRGTSRAQTGPTQELVMNGLAFPPQAINQERVLEERGCYPGCTCHSATKF